DHQPDDAMRHIGTNALPFLVEWIQYRGTPCSARARSLIAKLPPWIQKTSFARSVLFDKAWFRAMATVRCFYVLGPEAAPVAPRLIRLMNDPLKPAIAARAVDALSGIGQGALMPLLACVTNRALPATT